MNNKNELAKFLAERIIGIWDEVGNCTIESEAKQVKTWLIEFEDRVEQKHPLIVAIKEFAETGNHHLNKEDLKLFQEEHIQNDIEQDRETEVNQ